MRRVSGGDSVHSQSDAILHFGVAQAQQVDVNVTWPSGTVQSFDDIPVDDLVLIDEDAGILPESLTDGGSHWDAASGVFAVVLRSNYGGRTNLHVQGLGPLGYDAASCTHRGRFVGLSEAPDRVTARSERPETPPLVISLTR